MKNPTHVSRRQFLKLSSAAAVLPSLATRCLALEQAAAIEIGSRLELLVDDYLIDRTQGEIEFHLHKPAPREVVLVTDEPWEGNTSAYYTIFQDDGLYRMYYRGSHFDTQTRKAPHPEVTCYAQSTDGIHWTKPELGLFEFQGSKANSIVWDGIGTHDFTPFKDDNPACDPDARYKALGRGRPRGKKGLYAFKSPDGVNWSLMSDEPVITRGAFDSQNLAFWDPLAGFYRDYHRDFRDGVRAIMTCRSDDFLNWTDPVYLDYPNAPNEHLYTNAIQPYRRAPHMLLGFPTRYLANAQQQVEPVFMSSRDGLSFRRWKEPLIPVTAPQDRDGNRSNYMTWGLVQLPGDDKELSLYATEAYYTGPDSRVRRFTYRVDGFVSLRATAEGGELVTKPLKFSGNTLSINFTTATGGSVSVELQDAEGTPIKGFTKSDCQAIAGDAIEQPVSWIGGPDLSPLSGKPIRLRFLLAKADLYAFRFQQ